MQIMTAQWNYLTWKREKTKKKNHTMRLFLLSSFSFQSVSYNLTKEQTLIIIHAYIMSRLDWNNSLLGGGKQLIQMPLIQHSAAKIIFGGKKSRGKNMIM